MQRIAFSQASRDSCKYKEPLSHKLAHLMLVAELQAAVLITEELMELQSLMLQGHVLIHFSVEELYFSIISITHGLA
jgi:hypothetical protein